MVDVAFGATAMASIFAIVDPLGVVPFFSVLTEDMPPGEKRDVMGRRRLVAVTTLGVFAVFGHWIFAGFGFTIPAFQIAGGVLLFGVALEMLHGERPRTKMTERERQESLERESGGGGPPPAAIAVEFITDGAIAAARLNGLLA